MAEVTSSSTAERHTASVTASDLAVAFVPQAFPAFTVTEPAIVPHLAVMLLVPAPVVTVAPVGTVQA